jgi:hypothetical protein
MPDPFGRIHRNLTGELIEGASDGAVKKSRPNWSNIVADDTNEARALLSHVEGGYDWSAQDGDKNAYVRGRVRGA